MLCINPFRPRPGVEHGCGQCTPCRINARRVWVARILLESFAHTLDSSFATITYGDDHVPQGGSVSSQDWRSLTKGCGFRYFGVAEYGERTFRPHFHLIAFGTPPEVLQAFLESRWRAAAPEAAPGADGGHGGGAHAQGSTRAPEPAGRALKGFIDVRPFVQEHAEYVAGYCVKKLTKADDARLSDDQAPEFARMSRRPGIGVPGLRPLVDWLGSREGSRYLASRGDVPAHVGINRRMYPLGRTLVEQLRASFGIDPQSLASSVRREAVRQARVPELEDPRRLVKRRRQYDSVKRRIQFASVARRI